MTIVRVAVDACAAETIIFQVIIPASNTAAPVQVRRLKMYSKTAKRDKKGKILHQVSSKIFLMLILKE